MKKIISIAAITTSLAAATAFAAQSNIAIEGISEGDMLGKTESEITTALNTLGATISEIDTEDDEIEITLKGVDYEVEIDKVTGLISEVELEDHDNSNEDEDK